MKRNKKLILSLSAFMLFAVLAVTVASLSFADENGSGGTTGTPTANAAVSSSTRIDEIIANSNSTSADVDSVYHIVEIGSGSASGLQGLAANDGFKNIVIDPNSSDTAVLMKTGKVEYHFVLAKNCTTEAELQKLTSADLIYISNDPKAQYSTTNDIPEDAYNILHTAALADYKPIIIDSKAQTEAIGNAGDTVSTKMGKLVDEVFNVDGKYYYTYPFVSLTGGISDYFAHKGSMYIGINGTTRAAKWDKATSTGENAETKNIAKFLVVGTSSGTITSAVTAGATPYAGAIDGYTLPTGSNIYDINSGSLKQAYNSYFDTYPDYVEFSYVDATGLAAIADLDAYDMVIIENGALTSTSELGTYYNTLQAAVYGKVHIIYDIALAANGSDGQGTAGTTGQENDTNYLEIFYMLVTSGKKEVARTSNVMLTNRNKMEAICTSNSPASGKVIADLINASSYRGVGGPGSSSSMYTVLEIQPCYPIDLDVAKYEYDNVQTAAFDNEYDMVNYLGKYNYYIYPSNVINNSTKEAVSEDGDNSVEYYAWELSEAKIADALGTDVDHVKVVHMSTEELATSKIDLVGTYDMIYIGGNTSALKDAIYYKMPLKYYTNSNQYDLDPYVLDSDKLLSMPIYAMYSHNGDYHWTWLNSMLGSSPFYQQTGTDYTANYINGQKYDTFTVLNGNDITYNKYVQFKAFIDAGYPVVVSNEVTDAYNAVKTKKYYQNSIDPDSNIAKVLSYADGKNNVLWGFADENTVKIDNAGGKLGNTLTGYVRVFADGTRSDYNDSASKPKGDKARLVSIINASAQRPKLILTQRPKDYDENDSSTVYSQGESISFKTEVDGLTDYTVKMYIDDNGNSLFESSEKATLTGSAGTYSLKLSSEFFGPLYWKIEITGTKNGKTVTVYDTGLSYVKATNPNPEKVKVLQIVSDSTGPEGCNQLYFCVTCNQAYKILDDNPKVATGVNFFADRVKGEDQGKNVYYINYNDDVLKSTNIGKHKHHFGIWYYDSAMGMDDLTSNLADSIDDLYTYDLDILYASDYVNMCQEVRDAYSGDVPTKEERDRFLVQASAQESIIENLNKKSDSTTIKAEISAVESNLKTAQDTFKSKKVEYGVSSFTDGEYGQWEIGWKDYFIYNNGTDGEPFSQSRYNECVILYNSIKDYTAELDSLNNALNNNKSIPELESELNNLLDTEVYNYIVGLDSATPASARDYIASIKYNKTYYDVFNVEGYTGDIFGEEAYKPLRNYYKTYKIYMNKIDQEIMAKKLYDQYNRYVCYYDSYIEDVEDADKVKELNRLYGNNASKYYGLNWINKCYDTIVLGPAENFGGDDITGAGLDCLERFTDSDGTVLMFHDTLSLVNGGAKELTSRMRSKLGADAYGEMTFTESPNGSNYNLPYKTKDSNKYFLTKIQKSDSSGKLTDDNILSADKHYLTNVCYTDFYKTGDDGNSSNCLVLPYICAETSFPSAASWANEAHWKKADKGNKGAYGTDKASQTNQGIVTMFPFKIASEINISPTHSQAYAADIEDNNMTVWYTMAGGTNPYDVQRKIGSSLYAASPRDGKDSYFIYSYGNVSYCGTGHTKVCGLEKDNNDERRLYINIISNSVRKSAFAPTFIAYDYESASADNASTSTANELKKLGDDYILEVGTTAGVDSTGKTITVYDKIKFAFALVGGDSEIKNAKNVKVFFDLDGDMQYTANYALPLKYTQVGGDVLISQYPTVSKNVLMLIADTIAYGKDAQGNNLFCNTGLQDSFFIPYNMEYTYIVITADGMDPIRIKIKLKEALFDLN